MFLVLALSGAAACGASPARERSAAPDPTRPAATSRTGTERADSEVARQWVEPGNAGEEPRDAARRADVDTTRPVLRREMLLTVLSGGLGRFLQNVETAPAFSQGRFVGFRLLALRGPLADTGIVGPGDVLVRVNGMPVERPEQALAAWESLRVASELRLELLRDGRPYEARVEVID
ncbi:MAG: hypothetical protein RMK74_17110 [Myxococcales bacterium]|nr:hypothetical protein [Myxococcales bacterium]